MNGAVCFLGVPAGFLLRAWLRMLPVLLLVGAASPGDEHWSMSLPGGLLGVVLCFAFAARALPAVRCRLWRDLRERMIAGAMTVGWVAVFLTTSLALGAAAVFVLERFGVWSGRSAVDIGLVIVMQTLVLLLIVRRVWPACALVWVVPRELGESVWWRGMWLWSWPGLSDAWRVTSWRDSASRTAMVLLALAPLLALETGILVGKIADEETVRMAEWYGFAPFAIAVITWHTYGLVALAIADASACEPADSSLQEHDAASDRRAASEADERTEGVCAAAMVPGGAEISRD